MGFEIDRMGTDIWEYLLGMLVINNYISPLLTFRLVENGARNRNCDHGSYGCERPDGQALSVDRRPTTKPYG